MENYFIPADLEAKALSAGLTKVQMLDEFDCLVSGILYQQVVDWFKDSHNITIEPWSMLKGVRKATYETVFRVQKWHNPKGYRDSNYKTLNKAIEEAFKLI